MKCKRSKHTTELEKYIFFAIIRILFFKQKVLMGHDAHFDQKLITTLSRDSPYMMCIFGYAICLLHIEVILKADTALSPAFDYFEKRAAQQNSSL